MARKGGNLVDRFADKVALGLGAAALLAVIGFFFVSSPYKSPEGKAPTEVCEAVAQEADRARQAVVQKRPQPSQTSPVGGLLDQWFGNDSSTGLLANAGLPADARYALPWPLPLVDVVGTSEEDRHDLARLLPPEKPVVKAGRSTFRLPVPVVPGSRASESESAGPETTLAWANVVAQIDLLEQGRRFRAQRYGSGMYYLPIVEVQLQRRPADVPQAAWEEVGGWRPYAPLEVPAVEFTAADRLTPESQEALDAFRKILRRYADEIGRPKLPAAQSGDPVVYPEAPWIWGDPVMEEEQAAADALAGAGGSFSAQREALRGREPKEQRRYKKWLRQAELEMRSSGDRAPNLDLAAILLEAALGVEGVDDKSKARERWTELQRRRRESGLPEIRRETFRRPEKMMPIQASDTEVVPGQAYVYRMRYAILNHYVGQPAELRRRADARRVLLYSDWSEPSAPVEVWTDVLFQLTAVNAEKRTATVNVYRWASRQWNVKRFTVEVGEEIGGSPRGGRQRGVDFSTGVVVVDVIPEAGETGGRLVYCLKSDTRLNERYVNLDRDHPKYTRLVTRKVAGGT